MPWNDRSLHKLEEHESSIGCLQAVVDCNFGYSIVLRGNWNLVKDGNYPAEPYVLQFCHDNDLCWLDRSSDSVNFTYPCDTNNHLSLVDHFLCSFPTPRTICFRRCLSVCLLATLCKNLERICMNFSGKVGNGPMNNWLNFVGDLDHRLDTRVVFWIRHCWEMWKVVNGQLCIVVLIRQMVVLVSRALAEVCTVPVLLVLCTPLAVKRRSQLIFLCNFVRNLRILM